MKTQPIILLLLSCVLLTATTQAADERQLIRKAIKAARAGQHEEALRILEPAGTDHPAETAYNRGRALYRLERFDEAAQAFDEAARTTNLKLQQPALYNRGNALLGSAHQTLKAPAPDALDQALQNAETALESYEQALNLEPEDTAAQYNAEVARKAVEKLKKLKEEQEKQQQQQEQQQQQQDQEQQEQNQQQDQQQEQQPESSEENQPQQPDQSNPPDQPDQPDQPEADGAPEPEAPQPEAGTSGAEQPQPAPQPERRAEELTPEEAERLLDAMKRNEQNQRPSVIYGRALEVEKNW